MSELEAVFLYNLGDGFTEIRKVGYRYLQRQPNGRFVHLLVWLFNDQHVRVTFECHRKLMPQHVMDFLVEVGRIPAGLPVAVTPIRIAEPPPSENRSGDGSFRGGRFRLCYEHCIMTLRKVVRAVRKPSQLAVPVISFWHRLQFQG
ncbi:hypothetical protein PIB30_088741, partial [Stylosanthes scabra]|nr:hypothetical protein [Stylosanthes scabra]